MRNKILILALAMFLILALVGCNFITPPTPGPVEVLSAEVIVIKWEQPDDYVNIDYLITNIGTIDIDFSKVLFEVTYEDEGIYTIWKDGVSIGVDCCEIVSIEDIWVGDKVVSDVVAIDWELASY
jgi:hypothetical protein